MIIQVTEPHYARDFAVIYNSANTLFEEQDGSCQPKRGIITLNSQLIKVPRNCIEYVVLHEFAHYIHPNHSRQFWDFVTMMMPDWKERKKELDKSV